MSTGTKWEKFTGSDGNRRERVPTASTLSVGYPRSIFRL